MEVSVSTVVAFFAALCIIFLLGKILGKPARWIGRLLLNGIIGGVVLYLVNRFGGLIGLHAALNPFTALIAGTLGIPLLALVLVLPLLLTQCKLSCNYQLALV